MVFDKFKDAILRHKTIIANFSYLSILQVVNLVLPLITYPYLIRVLGANLWGKIVFAQVVISYFSIFIRFGFQLTGAKDVSIHRDDSDKLSEIVSSILIIKTLLVFLSLSVLMLVIAIIPVMREDFWLYLFTFTLCINEWLLPIWYFQGIEKMKYITLISLISRMVFFFLIFILIKSQKDYLLVPLLNGTGALIGGVIALYVLFKIHGVKFHLQRFNILKKYWLDSLPLFGSMAIIFIRDNFNIIFIKIFLGTTEVAIYDLGNKLMNLFNTLISLINSAIFPKIMREKNIEFLKKVVLVTFTLAVLGFLVIQPFFEYIIRFLGGPELITAVPVARLMLIAPIIAILRLFPDKIIEMNGRYKIYTVGNMLTVILYLFIIAVGVYTPISINVIFFAVVILITGLFETLYRYFYCKAIKLI